LSVPIIGPFVHTCEEKTTPLLIQVATLEDKLWWKEKDIFMLQEKISNLEAILENTNGSEDSSSEFPADLLWNSTWQLKPILQFGSIKYSEEQTETKNKNSDEVHDIHSAIIIQELLVKVNQSNHELASCRYHTHALKMKVINLERMNITVSDEHEGTGDSIEDPETATADLQIVAPKSAQVPLFLLISILAPVGLFCVCILLLCFFIKICKPRIHGNIQHDYWIHLLKHMNVFFMF